MDGPLPRILFPLRLLQGIQEPVGSAGWRVASRRDRRFLGVRSLLRSSIGLFGRLRILAHGKRDAMALFVHLQDGDGDPLLHLNHVGGRPHEVVGKLAHMHQPVLMDADVDEGPEVRDVGDDSRQLHARLEVVDLVDSLGKGEGLELDARVAPGLGQLIQDVGQRRQADSL